MEKIVAGCINDEQALAILYDLALTIGAEVNVEPLMVRTLQRLLYHTGFPVGLWLDQIEAPPDAPTASAKLRLAIGDHRLAQRRGDILPMPAAVLENRPALIEDGALLAAIGLRRPAGAALRLPLPGHGMLLLAGPAAPAARLSLADLFAPILERLARSITLCQSYEEEVQHRLERAAYYDPLTGLPNATLFHNTMQQAVQHASASGRWLALVHLDLDDFRRFNEEHGSEFGDRTLIALARRLSAYLRPGELLARIAGDEFGLLLPDLNGWDDIDERIVRILQASRSAIEVDGEMLEISFSAGIAALPADSEDSETLTRHAQMALHQAKQEERGYFRLFDADQDKRAHTRRELLHRLETALADGELRLYYQPKVDMPTGRVLGFEALLRWFHPERGMILPGQFLPLVENSDFIIHLGEWLMREVLRQTAQWRAAGLDTCVSVNIAGRHLQLPDFAERVRRALQEVTDASPSNLEIEILESSVLDDLGHVRKIIRECGELGVKFSLDDFGSGYSSLAYLHQLPAETIKIDQLFVRNLFVQREDPAIILAVVQIAQVFGRRLVAEGVEDPEHGMLLMCMGCRGGQGFGIARPMPVEAVLDWVRAYRRPPEWEALHGLAWHASLYDLFRHRFLQRQWRDRYALPGGEGAPDALWQEQDDEALAGWLRTLPQSSARKALRLLEQASEQRRRIERLVAAGESRHSCNVERLLAASDDLLRALDELAPQLHG